MQNIWIKYVNRAYWLKVHKSWSKPKIKLIFQNLPILSSASFHKSFSILTSRKSWLSNKSVCQKGWDFPGKSKQEWVLWTQDLERSHSEIVRHLTVSVLLGLGRVLKSAAERTFWFLLSSHQERVSWFSAIIRGNWHFGCLFNQVAFFEFRGYQAIESSDYTKQNNRDTSCVSLCLWCFVFQEFDFYLQAPSPNILCLKTPNTRVNGLRALQQHNLDPSFIVCYLSIFKFLLTPIHISYTCIW